MSTLSPATDVARRYAEALANRDIGTIRSLYRPTSSWT